MSTTTIRLPEELKKRVRLAAARSGATTHGFILQAIVQKTEQEALRQDFVEAANQRSRGHRCGAIDTVFTLTVRSQREAGYARP